MTRDLLILLLATAVVAAVFAARPIDDLDLLTQIRLGQLLLSQGMPPIEPLSYTLTGTPFIPLGWLAQGAFAWLYNTAGFDGIRLVRGIAYAGALLLTLTAPLGKTTPGLKGQLFGLAFGALAIASSANARPQVIAALCFALIFRLLVSSRPFLLRLLWTIVIAIIWQNAHPSLATAVALGALLTVASAAEWGRPRGRIFHERLVLTGVLGCCQIFTPLGNTIFDVAKMNLIISTRHVFASEWFPAWMNQPFGALLPFWFLLAVSVMIIPVYRANVRLQHLLLALPITAAALFFSRFVLHWGLLLAPIWAAWLGAHYPRREAPAARGASALCALALVGLPILAVDLTPTLPAEHLPTETIQQLSTALPSGRIFNHRDFAGALHLFGSHGWTLAVDGRLYLYPPAFWQEYSRISAGKVSLDEVITLHRPDGFVLQLPEQKGLHDLLAQSPLWQRLTAGPTNSIFVRTPPVAP